MFVLSSMIFKAWLSNEFVPCTIYGPLRIGKSAYAIKVMAELHGMMNLYLEGKDPFTVTKEDWDYSIPFFQRYLKWHPKDYVDLLLSIQHTKELVSCWDDAGFWLHALEHQNPFVKAYSKYQNLTGIDFGGTIYTTPDPTWITKKVRGIPQMYTIKVIKATGNKKQPHKRLAKFYQSWMMPDMKKWGVKWVAVDRFDCMLPDEFYSWYYPLREKYNVMAKELLRKELSTLQDATLEKTLYAEHMIQSV